MGIPYEEIAFILAKYFVKGIHNMLPYNADYDFIYMNQYGDKSCLPMYYEFRFYSNKHQIDSWFSVDVEYDLKLYLKIIKNQ